MKLRAGSFGIALVVALVIVLTLSLLIGPVSLDLGSILRVFWLRLTDGELPRDLVKVNKIVMELRFPRAVLLILSGAALASSGASYQGLFRNSLADPFLIGVSSGAGLGAIIAQTIQWRNSIYVPFLRPVFALGFGILVVVTVFIIGRESGVGGFRVNRLILAGVAMNSFCSALTSLFLVFMSSNLHSSLSWMIGGVTMTGWQPVLIVTPLIVIGLVGQLAYAYPLNVLQFGDAQAMSLGLDSTAVQHRLIFFATLTTAAAISFTGVIGFVGLIVPHVIRFCIGADYRKILPLSILGGGLFLLTADLIARRILAPQELPVGMVTALTGAPFFFYLLVNRQEGDGAS